jgi:hypothetical protein
MKSTVFFDVRQCVVQKKPGVSEEHVVTIFGTAE